MANTAIDIKIKGQNWYIVGTYVGVVFILRPGAVPARGHERVFRECVNVLYLTKGKLPQRPLKWPVKNECGTQAGRWAAQKGHQCHNLSVT